MIKIFFMILLAHEISYGVDSLYQKAIHELSLDNYLISKNIFIKIMELEPAFYPPLDASPKIKKVFNRAKQIYFRDKIKINPTLNYDIKDNNIYFQALMPDIASKITRVEL